MLMRLYDTRFPQQIDETVGAEMTTDDIGALGWNAREKAYRRMKPSHFSVRIGFDAG